MLTALVLAGRRSGDPSVAPLPGRGHRALQEVAGVPMLVRVVRSLRATPGIARIIVSIDEPAALEASPELRAAVERGDLTSHRSLDSPSRSVSDVLTGAAAGEAVLVTTADHALLTPEVLAHFAAAAENSDADALVGVVAASVVRARYPEAVRTVVRLRGEGYTGANLFAFRSERGQRVAAFWVKAERFRKQPWRLVRVFGAATLLLFALRRLDLDAAFARASLAIGARVRPVVLPFAEAAIDVDRPSDLVLAERILAAREGDA